MIWLVVGLLLSAGGRSDSGGLSVAHAGHERAISDVGPAASDGGSPDAGTDARDQEIIDHLQEIELLDLLQNLELFDTAAQDPPDGGG